MANITPPRLYKSLCGVTRSPAGLLGRHVFGRAHQAAIHRQPIIAEQSRDAEIGQLDFVVGFGQQQIGRLDIAMNDAMIVRMPQRLAQLDGMLHHFAPVNRRPSCNSSSTLCPLTNSMA